MKLPSHPLFKIVIIIFISLLTAHGSIWLLENDYSTRVYSFNPRSYFEMSPNIQYFNHSVSVMPGYVKSVSDVYACFFSKYADSFDTFKIELSLNGKDWYVIPLQKLDSIPTSVDNYSLIGRVPVDRFMDYVFYGRYYFPPQDILIPSGITQEEFYNSIKASTNFHLDFTPRDKVLEILVGVTIFSLTLSVLRFMWDELSKMKKTAGLNLEPSKSNKHHKPAKPKTD